MCEMVEHRFLVFRSNDGFDVVTVTVTVTYTWIEFKVIGALLPLFCLSVDGGLSIVPCTTHTLLLSLDFKRQPAPAS